MASHCLGIASHTTDSFSTFWLRFRAWVTAMFDAPHGKIWGPEALFTIRSYSLTESFVNNCGCTFQPSKWRCFKCLLLLTELACCVLRCHCFALTFFAGSGSKDRSLRLKQIGQSGGRRLPQFCNFDHTPAWRSCLVEVKAVNNYTVFLVIIGIICGEFLPSLLSFKLCLPRQVLHFKRQPVHLYALVVFDIAAQLLKSTKKWRLRVPLMNVILIIW